MIRAGWAVEVPCHTHCCPSSPRTSSRPYGSGSSARRSSTGSGLPSSGRCFTTGRPGRRLRRRHRADARQVAEPAPRGGRRRPLRSAPLGATTVLWAVCAPGRMGWCRSGASFARPSRRPPAREPGVGRQRDPHHEAPRGIRAAGIPRARAMREAASALMASANLPKRRSSRAVRRA